MTSRINVGLLVGLIASVVGTTAEDASAGAACACGVPCPCELPEYHPAAYTTGAAGDVAVLTESATPSFGQQLVASVVAQLVGGTGPQYVHTKILAKVSYLPVGSTFTETFTTEMPPSTSTTGEPNECSKLLSPFYLQRMSPGVNTYYEDATPGVLVKAMGSTNCLAPDTGTTGVGATGPLMTAPLDGYHISTILNDAVPGGTCEKELVDYCGVPVEYNKYPTAGDRKFYSATQGFSALNIVFNEVYNICMGTIGSSWPAFGIGCGGTSEQVACLRAGWQVVDEFLLPAYPEEVVGLGQGGGPPSGAGWNYMNGWSDFNVLGPPPNPAGPFPPPNYNTWATYPSPKTMLGAAKSNGAVMPNPPNPGCSAYSGSSEAPGTCDNGGCNSFPTGISGASTNPVSGAAACIVPNNFTANIPQNILYAATRLGKTVQTVVVGSGITAGYTTYVPSTCTRPCEDMP